MTKWANKGSWPDIITNWNWLDDSSWQNHEFNILKLSEKEEVCFALSKKSLDLLNKINSILKDMESDGFMKNLKNKWNIMHLI